MPLVFNRVTMFVHLPVCLSSIETIFVNRLKKFTVPIIPKFGLSVGSEAIQV